jgi:hypothetical protein
MRRELRRAVFWMHTWNPLHGSGSLVRPVPDKQWATKEETNREKTKLATMGIE